MIKKNASELANDLVDYINKGPTMFNAVQNSIKMLEKNGFKELDSKNKWKLEIGGKYYVSVNSSALFAFIINGDRVEEYGFRIIGSHCDSPGYKLKPNPEISTKNGIKLNVEPYGGMIASTWFDRPLAIAGKVMTKNKANVFSPNEYIINIKRPVCIIPNLAIHMNRNINSGYEYNQQNDMMPVVLESGENLEENYILKLIHKELDEKIEIEDILDFELYLYEYEKGSVVGDCNEFISCGRLDNLASAHSSILALIDSSKNKKSEFSGISLVSLFNNEEIGSLSKEGAGSNSLLNIIERICISLNKDREDMLRSFENSFMISADLAHALHPNKQEKADITNKPIFGKGPTIKVHAGRAYASDSFSVAVFKSLCLKNNIDYQIFVNRSDMKSGSTIGSIITSSIPIPIVDVGIPILAMHSIRELAFVDDYMNYYMSMYYFF